MDTIKLKTSSGDKYSIDVDYKQVLKHKNKVIKNSGADADRLIFSNGEKIKLFYDKNYDFDKVVIYLLDGSFKIVNDKNNGGEKIKLLGEKFKLYQDDVYYQKNLKFKIPNYIDEGKYQFIAKFIDKDKDTNFYYITRAYVNNEDMFYY